MSRQYVALSGIAMVLIVLHHSIDLYVGGMRTYGIDITGDWQHFLLIALHRLGKVAVPLFLFISGSFVAYAARGNPPKVTWQTAQASILRLLWPYLIWSAVFYAIVYFQLGDVYSLTGYIKNLLVGYPYHFIPLLIFFYAVSPLLAPIGRRFGLLVVVLIGLYQVLLIGIEFPGTYGVYLPSWLNLLSPPILGGTLALWAIYFPLGLVLGLNMKSVKPSLQRAAWVLVAVTLVFYILDVLDVASTLQFPLAVHIYPLSCVLLAPLVPRKSIPMVQAFETVGKSTYGLYLTHLLVVDLALLALYQFVPSVLAYPLITVATVFIPALMLPLLAMSFLSTGRTRPAYRYVFG